jgi:hypothetical protein
MPQLAGRHMGRLPPVPDAQELVDRFGEIGESVPCDHSSRESVTGTPNSPNNSDRDEENRGKVWEIWDKTTRRVVFIAPEADNTGESGLVLMEQEDPLSLTGSSRCRNRSTRPKTRPA